MSEGVGASRVPGRPGGGRAAVAVPPALLALLLGAWATGRPALWTDEFVTIDLARRPVARIWATLGGVDAVHGLYYLLMHVWVQVAGTSATAVRLPSVLGVAAAAAGTALLGRALAGRAAGLAAGIAYALIPVTGQYALEARSYALVSAAAVLATLALVRALGRRPRFAPYALYAAAVALLGALHLFALLLVPAHLVTVLALRPGRRAVLAWTAAAAAAGAALAPLVWTAAGQQGAVSWIPPADARHLWLAVLGITGSLAATVLLAALCVWGLARSGAPRLAAVAVPWLAVPPVALLALSQAEPFFVARYVLFCVPALALLLGAGAVARPRPVAVPVAAALLVLAAAAQPGLRRSDAKWHDFTPVVRALAAGARPGDAFVVAPAVVRGLAAAHPAAFTGLVDAALAVPAADRDALYAREVGPRELARRLRGAPRVWLIRRVDSGRGAAAVLRARLAALRRAGFTERAGSWRGKRTRLLLYVRPGSAARPPAR
ncbi:glycosyltransferase family 39 protein [Actinomadura parmotrematis]|uniref:Glycosyltransferase family 39 protein n=1 Tax=Actinomadura parmotrematis TaxID=2864039 RepID=A0ABS7FP89_9ACTN|nr:glycosyltransferase family 39 protein [Actinomadura parmotrematis]MBW8481388.1 glycosyltransferase family 39 protein [Actinomadura parmotrematis]